MKKIIFVTVLLVFTTSLFAQKKTKKAEPAKLMSIPEKLAQEQLDAYNKRDIEAFLKPYSDSVEIYDFPNILTSKGKEAMRESYASMFKDLKHLYCNLVKRIVIGNTVIDEELVKFTEDKTKLMQAVAIYTIENGKIAKVCFILK